MLVTAVTPKEALLHYPPVFLPGEPDLSAFLRVLVDRPLGAWIANSTVITLSSVAVALVVSAFAGYSLSRFHSRFGSAVAYLLLATRMIPGTMLMVPLYVVFRDLGLLDTGRR